MAHAARRLYAIFDRLAEEIAGKILFMAAGDGEAIRTFSAALSAKGNIAQYPHEHQLWCLGSIDRDLNITPLHKMIVDGTTQLATEQLAQ